MITVRYVLRMIVIQLYSFSIFLDHSLLCTQVEELLYLCPTRSVQWKYFVRLICNS